MLGDRGHGPSPSFVKPDAMAQWPAGFRGVRGRVPGHLPRSDEETIGPSRFRITWRLPAIRARRPPVAARAPEDRDRGRGPLGGGASAAGGNWPSRPERSMVGAGRRTGVVDGASETGARRGFRAREAARGGGGGRVGGMGSRMSIGERVRREAREIGLVTLPLPRLLRGLPDTRSCCSSTARRPRLRRGSPSTMQERGTELGDALAARLEEQRREQGRAVEDDHSSSSRRASRRRSAIRSSTTPVGSVPS